MGESAAFVAADPATRQVTDPTTIPLLRRVVESLVVMRPLLPVPGPARSG